MTSELEHSAFLILLHPPPTEFYQKFLPSTLQKTLTTYQQQQDTIKKPTNTWRWSGKSESLITQSSKLATTCNKTVQHGKEIKTMEHHVNLKKTKNQKKTYRCKNTFSSIQFNNFILSLHGNSVCSLLLHRHNSGNNKTTHAKSTQSHHRLAWATRASSKNEWMSLNK